MNLPGGIGIKDDFFSKTNIGAINGHYSSNMDTQIVLAVFILPLEAVITETIFVTTTSCEWVESASHYFVVIIIATPL